MQIFCRKSLASGVLTPEANWSNILKAVCWGMLHDTMLVIANLITCSICKGLLELGIRNPGLSPCFHAFSLKWFNLLELMSELNGQSTLERISNISIIALMIIENRALWLASSFSSTRYNHRAVIITLKASSFQNGSQIWWCFGVGNWSILRKCCSLEDTTKFGVKIFKGRLITFIFCK